ncbi:MAG: nucleoside triphosphate pyrophosphohydrolase [Hyphomicrobiales bacterium]
MEHHEVNHRLAAMEDLIRVIESLRGPAGCPWDREQTPRSIVRYLLEEAYELADAIESEDSALACEELGDVLFHVLFLAHMYAEKSQFDLEAVCRVIEAKMKRRHPHVFGSAQVADSAEVVRNWQQIKQDEKKPAARASVLDSVPASLPGLMRAYAVSERAAAAKFDWEGLGGVLQKLEEELAEFRAACDRKDAEQVALEFGDILFTLVNVARWSGFHPETALSAAVKKFERRFRTMEKIIADSGRVLASVSQDEKDRIWEGIKSQ